MKRVLFIDRDGTIIVEPPDDFQVDSLDKLEFTPGAVEALGEIAAKTDYELVMVTNQDGLGTASFPEHDFWPAQELMMQSLNDEGVHFKEVLIDRSFEHENLSTRKPGIGLLTSYIEGDYDLENSFVIGDRLTDMQLAQNLGAKGIFISGEQPNELDEGIVLTTMNWNEIKKYLVDG